MANTSHWKRDVLLVPIIVGVVLSIAGYFVPKFFEKGKQISYSIEGPTAAFDFTSKLIVDGVDVANIYGYKVRVWNSGSAAVQALPVRFQFETQAPDFKIFNVTHETAPKIEFGSIDEKGGDAFSKRFIYQLLNASDQDVLTFSTNTSAPLSVYAKAEGLKLRRIDPVHPIPLASYLRWGLLVIGIVSSVLTVIFLWFAKQWTPLDPSDFDEWPTPGAG